MLTPPCYNLNREIFPGAPRTMATERQRQANRLNARRSTGPRTEAGKDRTRFNALAHGLAAQSPVLPHESAALFHEMRAALIEHYQPANIHEFQLIDHIAHAQLRMERSRRFENGMFDLQLRHTKRSLRQSTEPRTDDDTGIAACMCSPEFELGFRVLLRYDGRAESRYFKAVNALHRLREARLRREQAATEQPRPEVPSAAEIESVAPAAAHLAVGQTPPELPRHSHDSAEETLKLASFGETARVQPPPDAHAAIGEPPGSRQPVSAARSSPQ
jgi:hypothetical protein